MSVATRFGQMLLALALTTVISCKPAEKSAENTYSILDKSYSKAEVQSDVQALIQQGLVHAKERPELQAYLDINGAKSEGKAYKALLLELRSGDNKPLELLSAADYKAFLDGRINLLLPGGPYDGAKERAASKFGASATDVMGYEFILEPTFNQQALKVSYRAKFAEHAPQEGSQASDAGLKNYLISTVHLSICQISSGGEDKCNELRQDQRTQDALAHLFGDAIAQDFAQAKLVFVSDDYAASYSLEGDRLYLNEHQLKMHKMTTPGPVKYEASDRPLFYEGQHFGYEINSQRHNLVLYEKQDFFKEINKLARGAQFMSGLVAGTKAKANVSCFELGRKYAKCAAEAFEGLKCAPEDEIVLPVRCQNHEETMRGMKEGFGAVLKQ